MLAFGDTMCRKTYFCNMWSMDMIWHTVRRLFRRRKIGVDGYCSAKDNAEIWRALSIVQKKPQIKNGEGVRRGGPVYLVLHTGQVYVGNVSEGD